MISQYGRCSICKVRHGPDDFCGGRLDTAHRKAIAREQIDGPDEEDDASEETRLREGFEMLADEVDEDDGLPPGMRGIDLL